MIQSMTGFTSKNFLITLDKENKVNVTIHLKSLNSRFFGATCKLPYSLNHLETDFITLFKTNLHRGHIFFTIYISNHYLAKGTIEPSLTTIEGYIKAVNLIKEKYNIEGVLSLNNLLQLPNIFNVEEKGVDETAIKLIFDNTQELIDELITIREKEGLTLKKDLKERIALMQQEIDTIEDASEILMKQQKIKIHEEFKELDEIEEEASDTRKQMLYAMLDKIDIHEEIVRFKTHLTSLATQLETPTIEKGKRLDFTLQELLREINTISAKCPDAAIGSLIINIKVELEKAREQAQNIV